MAGSTVPDRSAALLNSSGQPWHRPEIARTTDGRQIIIVENAEAAHFGLKREHELVDEVGAGARGPTIFIWRSQPALIATHGQTRWPGFAAAVARLAEMGWPVLARRSGGGAFPIGPGTVQIAMIARYPELGTSMEVVYERLGLLIGSTLTAFGIAARMGDTPGAFCAGRHDLVVADRKIAGMAQHWRLCGHGQRCVTAAASVLVDAELSELAGIVNRFHALCGQTIETRAQAMTTVRDQCDAIAPSQRNLTAEFLAHLAAAAQRFVQSPYL